MKDTIYKYNTPLRIALLADLHDREFGWITDSLKAHKPDIICIATGRLKPNNGEYSAESVQACSDGAKNMLKGFAAMAAYKAAEQGNSVGAYLAGRAEKAVDDSSEKRDC